MDKAEKEFNLRLDPASCPNCDGYGFTLPRSDQYSDRRGKIPMSSMNFCSCPLGQQRKREIQEELNIFLKYTSHIYGH